MEYLTIDGMQVPKLGLGTWQIDDQEAPEIVRRAIGLGYRHIDTAQMYENERGVGAGIAASQHPREDLFITTKIWFDRLGTRQVIEAGRESVNRLGTGYVDLILIHWPNEDVPLAESLEGFRQLRDEGTTRMIGVSNFPPGLFDEARRLGPVVCEQVEYHVYLQQTELRDRMQREDLMLTAYCPLARQRVSDDQVLQEIGAKYDKSPAQVALRWLIEQPRVAAIPKASSEDHLAENLDIFDFKLSAEEHQRIEGLDRGERLIEPDFAPNWSR